MWDVATGKQNEILSTQIKGVSNVSFSPDGDTLAISFGYPRTGKRERAYEIDLWDVTTEKHKRTLIEHAEIVSHIAFSPDGKNACECKCG